MLDRDIHPRIAMSCLALAYLNGQIGLDPTDPRFLISWRH